ncbi:MAG: tyrosine-type recombinase/integrase [bacterium]
MTCSEWFETWLNRHKQGIKESTAEKHRYNLQRINERIGDIPLKNLTPYHIQNMYEDLLDDGLSENTVHSTGTTLELAMKQACKEKLLKDNPCDETQKPSRKKKEVRFLTRDEVNRLLEEVKGEWPYECFYSLAIGTGMRRGELLGLRWGDIDQENMKLRVVRQIKKVNGWNFEFDELKTKWSRRTIRINSDTMQVLKRHRKKQLELKLQSQKWDHDDLVFTDRDGKHLKPSYWKKHLKRSLDKAGCKEVTLHELRHTCATLLLDSGRHPKVVKEVLGHRDIKTTLDTYSHVLPDQQKQAAEDLGKIISV